MLDSYQLEDRMVKHAADVAELADAQASGACGLRLVEVRLLSSAVFLDYFRKNRDSAKNNGACPLSAALSCD